MPLETMTDSSTLAAAAALAVAGLLWRAVMSGQAHPSGPIAGALLALDTPAPPPPRGATSAPQPATATATTTSRLRRTALVGVVIGAAAQALLTVPPELGAGSALRAALPTAGWPALLALAFGGILVGFGLRLVSGLGAGTQFPPLGAPAAAVAIASGCGAALTTAILVGGL